MPGFFEEPLRNMTGETVIQMINSSRTGESLHYLEPKLTLKNNVGKHLILQSKNFNLGSMGGIVEFPELSEIRNFLSLGKYVLFFLRRESMAFIRFSKWSNVPRYKNY